MDFGREVKHLFDARSLPTYPTAELMWPPGSTARVQTEHKSGRDGQATARIGPLVLPVDRPSTDTALGTQVLMEKSAGWGDADGASHGVFPYGRGGAKHMRTGLPHPQRWGGVGGGYVQRSWTIKREGGPPPLDPPGSAPLRLVWSCRSEARGCCWLPPPPPLSLPDTAAGNSSVWPGARGHRPQRTDLPLSLCHSTATAGTRDALRLPPRQTPHQGSIGPQRGRTACRAGQERAQTVEKRGDSMGRRPVVSRAERHLGLFPQVEP
jgi:hypothetical protein